MKNLTFSCRRSDVRILPKDYLEQNSKHKLTDNWMVYCRFHDPEFKEKYPKGFLFRWEIPKSESFTAKKKIAEALRKEMQTLLDDENYNPVSKTYMGSDSKILHPHLRFSQALLISLKYVEATEEYVKDLKKCINRVNAAILKLHLNDLKVKDVKIFHVKNILEAQNLTPYMFNKFRVMLSAIFNKYLIEFGCIESNPCRDIGKKTATKNKREVFTDEKLLIVKNYLQINYPDFYRYFEIFFHSGCRTSELFRLQKKHVRLELQEFDILIKKRRGGYQWETKAINSSVLELWNQQLSRCVSDEDYLFAKKLLPDSKQVRPRQMSRRWERLVKDSEKIKDAEGNIIKVTEDFYSLKHLFLDKVEEKYGISVAQSAAGHLSEKTTEIYTTGKKERQMQTMKNIEI